MTWERTLSPLRVEGSMVTRRWGASTISDVVWQTMTEACRAGSAFVWTITAGRGLP